MTKLGRRWLLTILCMGALQIGCSSGEVNQSSISTPKQSNRIVAVSFALQDLTKRITGDSIEVDFPAANSPDPKEWSPSVDEIVELQNADLIVINGPGARYANWLTRVTVDESKFCNTAHNFGVGGYMMIKDYQIVHSHGPEGEHSHPYFVPYCWLDPNTAIKQAEQICASLVATYPNKREQFEANLESLKQKFSVLNSQSSGFDPQTNMICINPQPKYLTRYLGVADSHLLCFSIDEIDDLAEFKRMLVEKQKENNAKVLVTSFELSKELLSIVESVGLTAVDIDLIEVENGGDYFQAMKKNIQKLTELTPAASN